MVDVSQNYRNLQQQIEKQLTASQRNIRDVMILPVSKRKSIEDIQKLAEIGVYHFAENYAQEALEKITALKDFPELKWHFIGSLQSRKTKLIADNMHWLHSLETLKQAQRLSQQRTNESCPLRGQPLNICLQINWFSESQKGGMEPKNIIDFVQEIAALPDLKLRGLMLISKLGLTEQETEQGFYNMQRLFKMTKKFMLSHSIFSEHAEYFDTLSMGMSDDWQQAVRQGSTIIRIGTQIFGTRT